MANLKHYVLHIPLSDMATPLGTLYVTTPEKLQSINEGAKSDKPTDHYEVYNNNDLHKVVGRILKLQIIGAHLEITIGVKQEEKQQ